MCLESVEAKFPYLLRYELHVHVHVCTSSVQ